MACLAVHLWLIFAVGLRSAFGIFATTPTVWSPRLRESWQRGERWLGVALGEELTASNPVRNALAVYLHVAGIEGGYGFFAPNVPDNYKLVFELHYPDGRTEYDLPRVSSAASGLRLAGVLDDIADTNYAPLRQLMLKTLAYSVWQEHADADSMRAVFGVVKFPRPEPFLRGERESSEFMFGCDFVRIEPPGQQPP